MRGPMEGVGIPTDGQRALLCFPSHPVLPQPTVLDILRGLSVREKLLLGAVSRAWRRTLRDASYWASVDLSTAALGVGPGAGMALGGNGQRRVSDKLLLAVAAAAGGNMTSLDVSGHLNWPLHLHPPQEGAGPVEDEGLDGLALRALVEASPRLAVLRLLCPGRDVADVPLVAPGVRARHVFALLDPSLCPSLKQLDIDVCATPTQAARLLASPPVRVRRLVLEDHWGPSDLSRLAEGVAAHASLVELALLDAPLRASPELASLLAAVWSHGMAAVTLFAGREDSHLGGDALSALLSAGLPPRGPPLASLTVYNGRRPLVFASAGEVPRLCGSLRGYTRWGMLRPYEESIYY